MPTRSRTLPLRRLLAAMAALALVAAGCGDDDDDAAETGGESTDTTADPGDVGSGPGLEEYIENGITIGIANERPYGFEEDGEATGEAPELAREIFDRLGIEEVDFEVTEFGGLIGGLNAGRLDVIAAGMFITPERAEQVLFADPDYCATTSFAVPEGNPEDLETFEDVAEADVTLGVMSGAVEQGYAEDIGVPEGNIEAFQSQPDLFDALDAGRIDAVALTRISIENQVEEMDGFEATEGFFPVVDGEEQMGCGAFAFRYEDLALRNAMNAELHAMQEAEEVFPILEPFGFLQDEVDAAIDTTANEMAGGTYDDIEGLGTAEDPGDTSGAGEGGTTDTTGDDGGATTTEEDGAATTETTEAGG